MSYRATPKLVGTINGAGDNGGAICGIAILHNKLYAMSYKSEVIKVYNVDTPFDLIKPFHVSGLKNPGDIVALIPKTSPPKLFVIDWTTSGASKQVNIIDEDGQSNQNPWTTEDDYGRLSITKEYRILESFHDHNALVEYKVTGEQVKKFSMNSASAINHPHYAIKQDDTHFLLCHGDADGDLHRVCQVDEGGNLLKAFGSTKGSDRQHLNVPIYLQIDKNGWILVLDHYNGRLCLLNSALSYQQDLVTRDAGLRFPMKMFYDEDKDLLYVADNDRINSNYADGRVLIYNIKETLPI